MKSRRLELSLVVIFLLLGAVVRTNNLATIPAGFSDEEIDSIRVSQIIRAGTLRVFFDTGEAGVESLFHILQVLVVKFAGDGLLGYRLLPFWASMLELSLVFLIARRLFGPWVAFIALGTMCFGIQPVLVARTATHVSLAGVTLLTTLWAASGAYYLKQEVRPLHPKTVSYTLLGLCIVGAAYTHYTGLVAGMGILLFVLYLRYTRQPVSRTTWWNSAYAVALALIMGLPYSISILRNSSVSGPYQLWVERPFTPLQFAESAGRTALAFFWEGDSNPAHNVPALPVISSLEGVLLVVGLLACLLRWRRPNYGLLLIFFALGLLPDMWLRGGPDFHALALVSPLVNLLVGIGVVEAYRILRTNLEVPERLHWLQQQPWLGEWPRPLIRLFIVLLVLTAARNFWQVRQQVFVEWPDRSDTRQAFHANVGQFAIYLDRTDNTTPVLLCTPQTDSIDLEDNDQPITDPNLLEWMLSRDEVPFRVANCQRDFVLLNGGEAMLVLFVDPTEIATMPAILRVWLDLSEPVSSPYLSANAAWRLDAEQELADKGGLLQLVSGVFYPREPGQDLETARQPTRFGGNMTFLGHEPLSLTQPLNPGDLLTVVTYWRVDGSLLPNTGIFLRLHDTPQASPYSEVNQFEVNPSRLHGRDVVVQVSYLTLPVSLRDQDYLLTIGIYDGEPVNQLPVYDDTTGAVRGSYLLLGAPFMVVTP